MQNEERSTLDKEVGKRFRALRTEKDLTQAAVAARLEESGLSLDPTAITRIERGSRTLRLGEAVAIAAALDTSLERVLLDVAPEEHARTAVRQAVVKVRDVFLTVDRWMLMVTLAINEACEFPEVVPGVPSEMLSAWMYDSMKDELESGFDWMRVCAPTDEDLPHMRAMLELITANILHPQPAPDPSDDPSTDD